MDRDHSGDRLMREALRGSGSPASGACLDAETVAAWSEGTLPERDRLAAEEHASTCDRCLLLLATLDSLRPPKSEAPWWMRWRSVGWLVPVAASAIAIAVWVEVRDPELPPPLTRTSQAPATSPEPASQPPVAASPVQSAPVAVPRLADRAEPKKSIAGERSRREAESSPVEGRVERQAADSVAARGAPVAPPPVASPSPGAIAEQVVVPPAPRPEPARERTDTAAAAPTAIAGASAGNELRRSAFQRQPGAIDIASPDPQVRWRISGAVLERSTDAGRTWQLQSTGAKAPLLAGSCPAATVCWIVGRAGTVLVTTDGVSWQPRNGPEAVDLVAVVASDASTATVITATTTVYRTTDGARTWVSQKQLP
jgi:hypothetical protein